MYNLSAIHNTYRSTTGESPTTYDDTLQRTIKSNTLFRLNCPWPRFFTVFRALAGGSWYTQCSADQLSKRERKVKYCARRLSSLPFVQKSLVKITSQKSQIVQPIQYICAKPWLRPPLRITELSKPTRGIAEIVSLSSKAYTVSITLMKKKGNEEKRENKGFQQN